MFRVSSMSSPPSRPVIITGMHRSGTSLTASFLSALGIRLGNRLLSSDRTNPLGFFEDVDFVELHARMLKAATLEGDGGHRDWGWTESDSFDRGCFPAYVQAAQDLVSTRGAWPGLWGWKDPRTTLLLDFWDEILAGRALYVLLYRFPWEVADSMQRLGANVFLENPEYAFRIWAFYNRRLLTFYRGHADRAVLVSSNALRRGPTEFVKLLRGKLKLAVAEASFDSVRQDDLFVSFDPEDPQIRLTAATSPECCRLLAELDARADLPAAGLWNGSPLSGERLHSTGLVDLSVVIPCYNHGQFLVDAVASVERTATERCELVIVNDGSTQPRTLEVLNILRQAGYCIIDQANGGLAAARNSGISAARGRYILPLDADNRLSPGFIASAIRVLDAEPQIGVVYGDRLDFGARSGRAHVPGFDINALLHSNFIDACAVYRREIWQSCGGYDAEAAVLEDWDFWIAAAKAGWRFCRLSDVTFEYRVRPNSMMATAGQDRQSSSREYIVRKHHALYRDFIPMDKLSPEEASEILLEVRAAPQEVRASARFKLDAQVTNATNKTLYSVAPCPVHLAYHWIEKTTRQMVVFDGNRSGFVPGLDSNAARHYPMIIIAPSQPDEYILQTTLVQEGVCWFEDIRSAIIQEFAVSVIAGPDHATVSSSREVSKSSNAALIEEPKRRGVTIGIPIYRGKLFLEESLDSVQNQTYSDIEVILSLDGPDPECEEICRKFLTDSRFRLVVQPRQIGWMNHTNWLMSQVQTEFWHLQEQDDVILPTFLKTLMQYACEHPNVAAIFGDVRTFGILDTHMEMSSVIGSPVMRQMKLIYEHFPGVAPLGLIRTDALLMSGGLRANEFENFAADTALMAGLARWGELHRLPLELYRKRVHAESTHAAWWDWAMERRFKAWQAHCLDMLQEALLIEATPQDRRLLWLAVIERLVSPRTASYFLHIAELTAAERADMLDSFLKRARTSSIDISGSLDASWGEIDSWTTGYYWVP
jgi:glycosyltransferase involved in cell wall biosynthesis